MKAWFAAKCGSEWVEKPNTAVAAVNGASAETRNGWTNSRSRR